MARLHVDPDRMAQNLVVVGDEDHRYLLRVLRLGMGDRVTLFDGKGSEADAEIARIGPRAVELRVTQRRRQTRPDGPRLSLVQGLAKGEKFDLVVQKATELGTHRIFPAATERSIVRLEAERLSSRVGRWQKIAREAARQSGRADVPDIEKPMPFDLIVEAAPREALKLMLWEGAEGGLKAALATLVRAPLVDARQERLPGFPLGKPERAPELVLAVGPEGGFSDGEVALARHHGFVTVGLGPLILRTETAALAALAMIHFALGELD